jgi:hypothetical protein
MQGTRDKVKRIMMGCAFIAAMFVVPVCAGAPVVIEYYGENDCGDDLAMQQRLYEVVRRRDDVVFLNCRIEDLSLLGRGLSIEEQKQQQEEKKRHSLEDNGVPLFFNDFCAKRADEYGQETGVQLRGALGMIVNGRWIASRYDIMAAVNLGVTDDVKKIDMVHEGEVLHITLPVNMALPKEGKGVLKLFIYAPSTGLSVGEALDVPIKLETREKYIDRMLDDHKRLVPLEKEDVQDDNVSTGEVETAEAFERALAAKQKADKDIKEFFFRPVAAMEEIGVWDGSKTQYDISLSTIALETGIGLEKMGYVVLLHDGDGRGAPVIGAGEIIPLGDQMHESLPVSVKPDEAVQ